MPHKVLVGIPTLNNPDLLKSCLDSIYSTHDMYKGRDIRVIALDDGSTSENLEKNKIICAAKSIDLLMHKNRYGVARSWNNLSIHVDSDIVILLNDDVEVTHNWIDVIIYTLDNNPEIGVVGLNAYEGENSANKYAVPTYVESKIMLGGNLHPILSARGFAFGFRKTDYDSVGGFDNRYFYFFEEIDFNLLFIEKLKKRNCILSHPIIRHIHGATCFKDINYHSNVFSESKVKFEEKWNVKWEELRNLFNKDKIPVLEKPLNEWNSNFNIWEDRRKK